MNAAGGGIDTPENKDVPLGVVAGQNLEARGYLAVGGHEKIAFGRGAELGAGPQLEPGIPTGNPVLQPVLEDLQELPGEFGRIRGVHAGGNPPAADGRRFDLHGVGVIGFHQVGDVVVHPVQGFLGHGKPETEIGVFIGQALERPVDDGKGFPAARSRTLPVLGLRTAAFRGRPADPVSGRLAEESVR